MPSDSRAENDGAFYRCTCGANFDSDEVREIHEYNGHTVSNNNLVDA